MCVLVCVCSYMCELSKAWVVDAQMEPPVEERALWVIMALNINLQALVPN